MKEEFAERKTITYGDDFLAEMELCYILTENTLSNEKRYGVRIIKETIENGAHISEDCSSDFLFYSHAAAAEFLDMLIKYEVTPIALDTVIKDYFCSFGTAAKSA